VDDVLKSIDEIPSDDGDDDTNDELREKDYNNEREKENVVQHQFSLKYIRNIVQFFDEKDPTKRKIMHSFSNVQQHFKRVKGRSYIYRLSFSLI
jgi:hypothetical protein